MNRKLLAPVAFATVLSLGAAACGSDGDDAASDTTTSVAASTPDPTTGPDVVAVGVATPSAELRAGLTALLQEHVYLAGAAINQAVIDGGDLEAPGTAAAVETLDANSVALSEAIASVYGDDAGDQFLELWRVHIGFFVDYALGGATGDTDLKDQARAELDAYASEFGAFVESATEGELTVADVEASLEVHIETLTAAIDAVVAGDPNAYSLLAEAAQHMPMTANALAGAIAAQQGLS